jgi:hypothetical protein
MRRLFVLLCLAGMFAGCASDSDKAQWAEVMKDLRGDNMKMSTDSKRMKEMWDN